MDGFQCDYIGERVSHETCLENEAIFNDDVNQENDGAKVIFVL